MPEIRREAESLIPRPQHPIAFLKGFLDRPKEVERILVAGVIDAAEIARHHVGSDVIDRRRRGEEFRGVAIVEINRPIDAAHQRLVLAAVCREVLLVDDDHIGDQERNRPCVPAGIWADGE